MPTEETMDRGEKGLKAQDRAFEQVEQKDTEAGERIDLALENRVHGVGREVAVAQGKSLRQVTPRTQQGQWEVPPLRQDPVEILIEQAQTREPDLVPIRHGRMMVSPFTFYRGAAAIMAADLAATASSGLRAQLCGDAHLLNFGGYASPERDLVFDVNDFDETLPGPWEWDVKRLAASIEVAGRESRMSRSDRRTAVEATAGQYRLAMADFAARTALGVWYAKLDAADLVRLAGADPALRSEPAGLTAAMTKARSKDSMKAFSKLTEIVDGEPRIVADPPLIVPLRSLVGADERPFYQEELTRLYRSYRRTLQPDRRHLLEEYRVVDLAHKVVGVGSVGTRCWILLLMGRSDADPLFLQVKEAQKSVLARYAGKSKVANEGQRVVDGQRLMQASSDIFLGWIRATDVNDRQRDFYIRQLWDWKVSVDPATLTSANLGNYGRICAWTLARAHARSGDRFAIAAYLGSGSTFDRAIAAFATAYADQNERDYESFLGAVKSGRLPAEQGV
jgi:uncharacterized protein (DUF2252 family)